MKLSLESKFFQYRDDSEVVAQSPCLAAECSAVKSPMKLRKAIMAAQRKASGDFTQDNLKKSSFTINVEAASSQDMTNDCSSEGQRMNFNDAASVFSQSAISFLAQPEPELTSDEPKLSAADRESFFAPMTLKASAPIFKPTYTEFLPFMEYRPIVNMVAAQDFEPAYKQKEKTEICKFWL